ncbi:hypothetical protein [Nonomuraea rhizosphaerae]|uniref:hypothetical protein n=1 Tax=Nonomuraea rhizosphaerae TaxID=2665663 RepID=UPI001C5F8E31|nr:hypothetical protein [Nonomuraea rhizosphaerae]
MIIVVADLRCGDILAFEPIDPTTPFHIKPAHVSQTGTHDISAYRLWGHVLGVERVRRTLVEACHHSANAMWIWCGFGAASIMCYAPVTQRILVQRPT